MFRNSLLCKVVSVLAVLAASTATVAAVDGTKIKKQQAKEIAKIRKKAQKDTRSMAVLADYYFWGFGMPRSKAKALALYKKAYAAGDAMAVYQMGIFHETGLDVDNDGTLEIGRDRAKGAALKSKSIKGVEKLAKKGDGAALYLMATFYKEGLYGFKKDRKKFDNFLKKGAKKKYPHAVYLLGDDAFNFEKKSDSEVCDIYDTATALGSGEGAVGTATCYYMPFGRSQDRQTAKRMFEYGAKKGSVASMIWAAGLFKDEKGGKARAGEYYKLATMEGSSEGFRELAVNAGSLKRAYYWQQALTLDPTSKVYLENVQKYRSKDSNGRDEIIGIAPGVYTNNDLGGIAQLAVSGGAGYAELAKDFMLMGYIKSADPVTLLTLDNGFSKYGQLLRFSDDNKKLYMVHEYQLPSYKKQIVISSWDVKTKTLLQIRALEPDQEISSVSSDGKIIAIIDGRTQYWTDDHEDGDGLKLVLVDTETGLETATLLKVAGGSHYWFTYFTGDDKYLSVVADGLGNDRRSSLVIELATGNILQRDIGLTAFRREISNNGKHVVTHDIMDSDVKASYQRVPMWSVRKGTDGLAFEKALFSPDQRYWVMPETLFDLQEGKLVGNHGAAHAGVGFVPVSGRPLLVRFYSDAVVTYLMQGTSIQKISTVPYDVKRDISRKSIFSSDHSLIATNGVRADGTLKETFIQSYDVPDEKLIAEKQKELKAAASANEEMDDVLAMFAAGFDDMALEKFTEIVSAKPANSGPSLELLKRRADIDATLLGRAFKIAIDLAEVDTSVVAVGAFLEDYDGEPGTGTAVIENFVLLNSPLQKAGARIGDRIVSLNGRPYFPKNTQELKDYRNSIPAGEQVEVVLERNGKRITIKYPAYETRSVFGLLTASETLFRYGLIGNAAGHPGIAELAASKIEGIVNAGIYTRYNLGLGDAARQSIAMLRAVAAAHRGDMKEAYGFLIKEKSMKADKQWGVNHFTWYPDLFADLHTEPKKLAYILGVKVDDLPKLPETRVSPSPYWALDGRLIEPGVSAILKEEGGAIID